ncbi:MAG: 50S ribosomal protein L17 [Kiritimatiellae bacterium]|nr:50S ribosomal protein L17 [Kiritimatiellia bacterium]
MRHRIQSSRFGRSSSHQKTLLASLVCALIKERRIVTTARKAQVARRLAERTMTMAKSGTLAARRRALRVLHNKQAVKILFADLAPVYKDRSGGYCRMVKTGLRRGDASPKAILEWVGLSQMDRTKKKPAEEEKKPAAS